MSAEKCSYFKSFYNWNDMLSFAVFVFYYICRLQDSKDSTPQMGMDEGHRTVHDQLRFTILNIVMLIQSIIKIFFLTRVFGELGQLVQLVIQCIKDR